MIGVNQFARCRRNLCENPEPTKRINALVDSQRVRGNRGAADSVEAVATGDEIAIELLSFSLTLKMNSGTRFEAVETDSLGFKKYRAAGRQARGDQIFNDFVLGVNGDAFAAG